MPMFSIILPCHNAAKSLPATIAALQAQGEDNWELICVNDGSDDGTLVQLMKAAQSDPRIRMVHQEHQGQEVALRTGLTAALGEWVTFMLPGSTPTSHHLTQMGATLRAMPEVAAHTTDEDDLFGTFLRRDIMLSAHGFMITGELAFTPTVFAQIAASNAPTQKIATLDTVTPLHPAPAYRMANVVPGQLAA